MAPKKLNNMKHELQLITTKDNVLLVENIKRKTGDLYIGEGFAGPNTFKWAESQEKAFPNHKGVIRFSEKEIDPSIPLFRQEDIKRKERYIVSSNSIAYIQRHIIDTETHTGLGAFFEELAPAQDYCNFLNSKQDSVDVEALRQLIMDSYPKTDGYTELDQNHMLNSCILGYNASPKAGWSDEDMRKAIAFGWDLESNKPGMEIYKGLTFGESGDKFIENLRKFKQQPTTITLEWEGERPPVDEHGYAIFTK